LTEGDVSFEWLSFRVQSITARRGLALIAFATVVPLLPAAYGAWYYFLGGARQQTRSELTRLVSGQPAQDASAAAAAGDHRLILVHDGFDEIAPGVGMPGDDAFGGRPDFREIELFQGDDMTPADRDLNRRARAYASAYNRQMLKERQGGP
jgi:hypothetical protein